MAGHLYFHSPCFDGIASAALTLDFWRLAGTGLVGVGWMALLIALVISGALIVLALKKSAQLLWSLVLLVGFLGLASGSRLPLDSDRSFILLVAVLGLALVGATSWVAFRRFTLLWADEIFRGFYALAFGERLDYRSGAADRTGGGRPSLKAGPSSLVYVTGRRR